MNRIVVLLFIFSFPIQACAQQPVPSSSKLSFNDVVKADSLKKEILYHNAFLWLSAIKEAKIVVKDSLEGKLSGFSYFFVYSQSGLLMKLAGRISYQFSIEVKEGKYRYNFSDFIFYYYKQDRNYKMVETGKTKSLDDPKAAGWQKLWDQHRSTTQTKMTNAVNNLKVKIIYTGEGKDKSEKVEW